ncbi:hypothetical protein [Dactylosporangium sp. NPDC048998]|uniref:5'-methylthioadenosine/S-adenosylhomocysteine nucleosidase family protein n=1 Tax=Dactylosporangium sp. NPDC048998 TaxID=3363976 RepID=UPI0037148083
MSQDFHIGDVQSKIAVFGNNNTSTVHEAAGADRSTDRPQRPRHDRPVATIGIVTALAEEYDAVTALLDGARACPVVGDPATYSVGYLPSRDPDHAHVVAVSVLPEGGNDIAATACTNLTRSFPTVTCVLFAGIAAGVPDPGRAERHVRLGDIVVPWEVVDYDHVDVRPDGPRLRPGFPQPSPRMTAAVNRLLTRDRRGDHPWEFWLDTGRRPDLARFQRPPEDTDVLYAPDESGRRIKHPSLRRSGHRKGAPKVHRGRIGSADRSLRDAVTRDDLARRHDILAVEMEIKGFGRASFLNGVEWYVVRGISDYGDSRTTPIWRGYASLAAAAFTRALLGECDPLGRPDSGGAAGPGEGR